MPKATQLVLAHENRPGLLAQIAQVLGDAKVNILACLTTTSASEGLTRLILDNPDSAKKALARTGLRFREEDVLHIELPNEPGALAKFPLSSPTRTSTSSWVMPPVKGAPRRPVWFLPFPIWTKQRPFDRSLLAAMREVVWVRNL